MALIRGNTQIIDNSINLLKLNIDLLSGADWDITNGNNNAVITGMADPSNPRDVTNKQYVDGLIQGIQGQFIARVKAQANVAALTGAQTVDGVALVDGDNILLGDQTTSTEDGLYTVRAGAWERESGWAIGAGAGAYFVFIEEGTDDNKGFVCTNDKGSDVIGTDDLIFVQFSGAGTVGAGLGLTQNGSDIDVVASDLSINVNANDIGVNIGNTNGTSLEVSATGLELAQTVTGGRDFSSPGSGSYSFSANNGNFTTTTLNFNANVSGGVNIGTNGIGSMHFGGVNAVLMRLYAGAGAVELRDSEISNSANNSPIPLSITTTVNHGSGIAAGDVIDDFRAAFTDEALINAIMENYDAINNATVTTASNGITRIVDDFQLGGALSSATQIDTSFQILTIDGTGSVVLNPTDSLSFGNSETANATVTTAIPLAITATTDYGNGNGTTAGDVVDQFRTEFTDDGILNALCQVKAELDTYSVTTANGISTVAGVVELGGSLTKTTTINADYHDLTFYGNRDLTNFYEVVNFGMAAGGELSDFNIYLTQNFQADVADFIVNGSNVNFGTTQNSYMIGQTPDGTVPLAIATVQYVDNQISAADTRKYNETTALNIGGQTATLSSAPATGFANGVVYLNGIRQELFTDFNVTNAVTGEITFTANQVLTAGDVVIIDYSDQ